MNFIKGHINKRKVRYGYSIIEISICVCLMNIMIVSIISVYIFFIRDYARSSKEAVDFFYVQEAFRYIEGEISAGNDSVTVNNNSIHIVRWDAWDKSIKKEEYIKTSSDKLIVLYKTNGYTQTSNNILKNIEGFYVEQDDKLVKISIKLSKGKCYDKCFIIK